LSYEDLGKALAADFHPKVNDECDKREPAKKAQLLVGRKTKRNCASRTVIRQQGEGKVKCARRTNSIQRRKRLCVFS
jgi:hypothetical protein